MMNIKGWQRIGVVISVVWLLITCGAYFYELKNHPSEITIYLPNTAYEWVNDNVGTKIEHEKAKAEGKDFSDGFVFLKPTFSASGLAFFLLFPLVLAWLSIYIFLYTYQWVRRGFES
jgi:hypothetical protein